MREPYLWKKADMSWRTCAVVKQMQSNPTIFAAEATAISLALSYYRHMGLVHHDVVIYSD